LHQDGGGIVDQRVAAQDDAGRVRAPVGVIGIVQVNEGLRVRAAELFVLATQVVDQVAFQRVARAVEIGPDANGGRAGDINQRDIRHLAAFGDLRLAVAAHANVIAGQRDVGRRAPKLGAGVIENRPDNVSLVRVAFAVAVRSDDHVVGGPVLDGFDASPVENGERGQIQEVRAVRKDVEQIPGDLDVGRFQIEGYSHGHADV